MSSSRKTLMKCRHPQPEASYRLICFPWAGGGSNFYVAWGAHLPPNIEVYGITLAGRENRIKETPCESAQETVAQIAATIATQLADKPFIFFGHSMGALLSFETAVLLKKVYGRQPEQLYLSGISAPHSKQRLETVKDLSGITKEEFQEHLKQLGGTPPEVLADPNLLKLFLPALKADYTIVSQIVYELPQGSPLLSRPFTFFDGIEDEEHDYEGWKELIRGPFKLHKMPGGHFYLKDPYNYQRILQIIRQDFPPAFGC